MALSLMSFRMVVLVLSFTSLTAAQTQPLKRQEDYSNYIDESDALMKAISLAVDSKPEGHHGCISHNCALSSTSPDQQQFSTSSNALQLLCNYYNCRVALQWRLAHCRVALQWRLAHCRVE